MERGILIIAWRLFCDIKWTEMACFPRVSGKVMEHAGFHSREGETELILKGQLESELKFPFDYLSWMCLFTARYGELKQALQSFYGHSLPLLLTYLKKHALRKNN